MKKIAALALASFMVSVPASAVHHSVHHHLLHGAHRIAHDNPWTAAALTGLAFYASLQQGHVQALVDVKAHANNVTDAVQQVKSGKAPVSVGGALNKLGDVTTGAFLLGAAGYLLHGLIKARQGAPAELPL